MTTGLRRRVSVTTASGRHLYDGWLVAHLVTNHETSSRFEPIVVCEAEVDDGKGGTIRRLRYHFITGHNIDFIDNPEDKEE